MKCNKHPQVDMKDGVCPWCADLEENAAKKLLVQHLSSDVITLASNLNVFRSRMAYTVFIGPFILIGSFLIATKGTITKPELTWFWAGVLGVSLAYVGFAVYCGFIDRKLTRIANRWRRVILSLTCPSANTNVATPAANDIEFETKKIRRAYIYAFALSALAFCSVCAMLWGVLPKTTTPPPPNTPTVVMNQPTFSLFSPPATQPTP